MSYLLEIREVARKCPNVLRRNQLKKHADRIADLVKKLADTPTAEIMRELNSEWARSDRVRKICEGETPPTGNGTGMKEGARVAT